MEAILQQLSENWPAVATASGVALVLIYMITWAYVSLRTPRRKRAKFRHIKTGPGSGL